MLFDYIWKYLLKVPQKGIRMDNNIIYLIFEYIY